jgi:hypothetical protein
MVRIVTTMPLTVIATIAGSAAIQLNVAKLRLCERNQPVIDICEIIVDKDVMRLLTVRSNTKHSLVLYEAN